MLQEIAHKLEDKWTDESPVNAAFIELLNGSGFFLLMRNKYKEYLRGQRPLEIILFTHVGQTILTFQPQTTGSGSEEGIQSRI